MTDNLSRPLAGRCALITGSTAGIGLDTAEALGALGADLVINGFGEPQAIVHLCESLSQRHAIRVIHHGADCTRPDQVRALVGAAQDHGGGRLAILVNNAGFSVDSPIESYDPEVWDRQLALNLSAPFHAIRFVLPGMRAQGWGRIVNMASVMGVVALPNRVGYVATTIEALVRTLCAHGRRNLGAGPGPSVRGRRGVGADTAVLGVHARTWQSGRWYWAIRARTPRSGRWPRAICART